MPVFPRKGVKNGLCTSFAFKKPSVLEFSQVLRNRRNCHPKDVTEIAYTEPTLPMEQVQDFQPNLVARHCKSVGQMCERAAEFFNALPAAADLLRICLLSYTGYVVHDMKIAKYII